jgi:molybdenum cofactor cytidylyltransferase
MKAIAIILAAGESRRMGLPKGLLEASAGRTFVAQLVETFERARIPSVVVVGAHAAQLRAAHPTLSTVLNDHWPQGQLGSVQVGLRAALAQGAERMLVQPVDTPLVAPATVRRVLGALARFRVVIPTSGDLRGHPLGLRATAARAVLASRAGTLEEAVGLLSAQLVPVDDVGILDNFNSPEAYRRRFGHAPRQVAAGRRKR